MCFNTALRVVFEITRVAQQQIEIGLDAMKLLM